MTLPTSHLFARSICEETRERFMVFASLPNETRQNIWHASAKRGLFRANGAARLLHLSLAGDLLRGDNEQEKRASLSRGFFARTRNPKRSF